MLQDLERHEQIVEPSSVSRALIKLNKVIRHPDSKWNENRILRWSYHKPSGKLIVGCAYTTTHMNWEDDRGRNYLRGQVEVTKKRLLYRDISLKMQLKLSKNIQN